MAFFVNIGCKFLPADPKQPAEQTSRCGGQLPVRTRFDQSCHLLLSTKSCKATFFNFLRWHSVTVVRNVRIIGWEQLKVITDDYLLVRAIKSWRERYLQHPIPSSNNFSLWRGFIPSQFARKTVSTCGKLLNKNLEIVSGFDETLHRCLLSFLASPTSAADFFVAPTSKLFSLDSSTILCNPPQVLSHPSLDLCQTCC